MIGKNIQAKRWLAILAVIIFVAGGAVTAVGIQSLGDAHSGALVSSVGINSDIGQVWGYGNVSGHNDTYQAAKLATSNGVVTATFADGFNVTHIVAFEKNPMYDIQGILNKSLYYSTVNVKSTNGNLSSVHEMFGIQTNDSSLKNINDKAMHSANAYTDLEVYGNGVNQLNKSMAFSLFGLGSANYNNLFGIVINLNNTHVTNVTAISVEITQSFGAPFNVNLIEIFADVFAVEALVAVALVLLGMPKARGR